MDRPDVNDLFQPETPLPLMVICLQKCVSNLHTFCAHHEVLESACVFRVSGTPALPAEICERLLKIFLYRRQCYHNFCNRPSDFVNLSEFLQIFSDYSRTALHRVDFQGTELNDSDIALISRHPLVELNVSGCSKLTKSSMKYIKEMKMLKVLRLGDTAQSLLVGDNDRKFSKEMFKRRQSCEDQEFIELRALNLRVLTLNSLSSAVCPSAIASIVQPLKQLVYLDLSHCSNIGDLAYLTDLQNLTFLILHDCPQLPVLVDNICKIKTLR